jgi:quinolinate synthase
MTVSAATQHGTLHDQVLALKKERNAVILAHNYQNPEIQDVADFTGDSLGLSRNAARTNADMIVFCGVFFMAETAKMLSPGKKVLLPDKYAGCPMADMITAEKLREFKRKSPGSPVVCYVNSTAEVKAESDICCTSSNAVKVVSSLPADKPVLFVPDMHLARFVQEKTGREIIAWKGYCPTHMKITPETVLSARERHPDAVVLVHPECQWEVIKLADEALSTSQMIEYARKSGAKGFIIGTEKGILHQLVRENPDKNFYIVSPDVVCPNMKRITLEKVVRSLEQETEEITVKPEIAEKARRAIDGMLRF